MAESLLDFSMDVTDFSDMIDDQLSEYIEVADAAKILGVSRNRLRSWAEDS